MGNLSLFFVTLTLSCLSCYLIFQIINRWSKVLKTAFGMLLKVFFLILLISISLLLFFGTYLSITNYWKYDRLYELNEFNNIHLGWTKEELFFRMGKPTTETVNEHGYGGLKTEVFNFNKDELLDIVIKENKVVAVDKFCQDNSYESLGGISCGSKVDEVLKKYGAPKKLETSFDKFARYYNYPQFNLTYLLSNGKVYALYLRDKNYYPEGSKFPTEEEIKQLELEEKNKVNQKKIELEEKNKVNQKKIEISNKKKLDPSNELIDLDHCAPNLSKQERLRRLELKGAVRETGVNSYSNKSGGIRYSFDTLISCY
jgi:hypothetical protein